MNGAQALIRTLVDAGVDVCFMNPGTSEMHFVAALDDVPEMRGVLALFEGVATGAADGYARMADKPAADASATERPPEDVVATLREIAGFAAFWRGAAERVRGFESSVPPGDVVAIYGAGFYGAFIASCLADPQRVRCHLDQNPFLQGGTFDGRPVLPPAELPFEVSTVLVGLNPANARRIIADVPALTARELRYFYL